MSDENESEDVSEKRITLLAILEAFNAPIKFDQAWAIIYIVSQFIFLRVGILLSDLQLILAIGLWFLGKTQGKLSV